MYIYAYCIWDKIVDDFSLSSKGVPMPLNGQFDFGRKSIALAQGREGQLIGSVQS